MRASQLDDPLYAADDDPMLLAAEPMRPIRFEYLTTTRDVAIQTDMLERLGLVHVVVGRQLYAVNECDTESLRVSACELLMHDGNYEPTDEQILRGAERLLAQLVLESAGSVERSALRDSMRVAKIAQELRAQADADLKAHGVDMKARIAHAVAESEAA